MNFTLVAYFHSSQEFTQRDKVLVMTSSLISATCCVQALFQSTDSRDLPKIQKKETV